MDEGATALRNRPRPRPPARPPGPGRWSRAAHHRRRRAVAALVVAAIVLLVGIWLASGGGNVIKQLTAGHRPAGFFGQLDTLAGDGPGSFAAAQVAAENAAIDRTLAYTAYVRLEGGLHSGNRA